MQFFFFSPPFRPFVHKQCPILLSFNTLSPVLVELLEHPGGLTGSELGHADVGALDTFY